MTRLDLRAYLFGVTHICLPFLVNYSHPLCLFRRSVITVVCLLESFDESVLNDITFETSNVRLPTAWNPAVQASAGRADYLHGVDSDQGFKRDVKNKCAVVSYSVAKWHYTVAYVQVLQDPQPIDRVQSLEERLPRSCTCCLKDNLP